MLQDHPPRPLRKMVNVALAGLLRELEAIYSQTGRPSTLPPYFLDATSTLFQQPVGLGGSLYTDPYRSYRIRYKISVCYRKVGSSGDRYRITRAASSSWSRSRARAIAPVGTIAVFFGGSGQDDRQNDTSFINPL